MTSSQEEVGDETGGQGKAVRKGKVCEGEEYSPLTVLYCRVVSHAKTTRLTKQGVLIPHNSVGWPGGSSGGCPGLSAAAFGGGLGPLGALAGPPFAGGHAPPRPY